jgi:hypothetical protein
MRMGAAPGIAGSPVPEQEVSGVAEEDLLESPEGFSYLPAAIPPEQLRLVRTEEPQPPPW